MPDPLDLLTFSEGKSALSIDDTDNRDDLELPVYITAVSRFLDQKIGPTVARSVSGEVHDGGGCSIILRFRPVMSVASLTEYTGTTGVALTQMTVTSQPADGYALDAYEPQAGLYSGVVHRMRQGWNGWFAWGVANVVCTYTAGRSLSTTAVDARIKRAAGLCLKNMWRDREQSAGLVGEFDTPVQSFPTFAMPNAVTQLLAKELGEDEPWGIG